MRMRTSFPCVCMHVFVCICACLPVTAVHLPLCPDMGSFSAGAQCSSYSLPPFCPSLSLPLSVSLLSVSPSLSLSLLYSSVVTELSAQSNVFQHLLSHTLALLGEVEVPSSLLLSPIPSFPGAFSFAFAFPFLLFSLSLHLCHYLFLFSHFALTESSCISPLSALRCYSVTLLSPSSFSFCLSFS